MVKKKIPKAWKKIAKMKYEVWTAKNNPYGSKGKYISQFVTKNQLKNMFKKINQ